MDSKAFEEAVKNYGGLKKRFEEFKGSHKSPRILGIFKRRIPDNEFEELGNLEETVYDLHSKSNSFTSDSKKGYAGSLWHDTYLLYIEISSYRKDFRNIDKKRA